MSDDKTRQKPAEEPSCASPPCSMHEFAADFGLDAALDGGREHARPAPATPADEAPQHTERDGGD